MKICLLFALLTIVGCNSKGTKSEIKPTFFDIKGYFEKEAARLKSRNQPIFKTVSQNNISEQKEIAINDWPAELELFTASDLNKPAWKDSYFVKQHGDTLIYRALDNDLKTQSLSIIAFPSGSVKQISIRNQISNTLYSSTEQLQYIPDSLYKIDRYQKVLVMGSNSYSIVGKFKNH